MAATVSPLVDRLADRSIKRRALAVAAAALGLLVLVVVGFQIYGLVREKASGSRVEALRNGRLLLRFEEMLGLDVERGIQTVALRADWLVQVANVGYVWGYWPPVIAVLVALFLLDRRGCWLYLNALLVSGAVGLLLFVTFPVAPPRMVPGYVDTVAAAPRYVSIAGPGSLANPYGAMPSFHVGWLVLAGVASWRLVSSRWGRLVALLPGLMMALVVMVTANHYLVDAVGGAALALAGLAVAPSLYRLAADRPRPIPPQHRAAPIGVPR